MTTLLLSSRHTEDNQALWRVAIGRGWDVERVQGVRVPTVSDDVVLYLEGLFAPTIARSLGLRLLAPDDNWLVQLPWEYRKREVSLTTLAEARKLMTPAFVKPPNDKLFAAKVYDVDENLPTDYDENMTVLVAEPVDWEAEFRCFVLEKKVKTLSPYLRNGQLARQSDFAATESELRDAGTFAENVLCDSRVITRRAVALDVGKIVGRGWAVVEVNAAWGSGVYGCDPEQVLDVVRQAVERINTND